MVPLNTPELKRVSRLLGDYDPRSTVAQLAGLLTVPALQANTIRIETLVHLAVTYCRGHGRPGPAEIGRWLSQRPLGGTWIATLEDPVEDVFVTNVETAKGNRLLFEGIWEANAYYAQVALETLNDRTAPQECQDLSLPALALLVLSDCVAQRLGLRRWCFEPSTPKGRIKLPEGMADHAQAITFSNSEIEALGISRKLLVPFILRAEDKQALRGESVGHSSLERRPLVDFGSELVLALPHAVSPAIRRFVLSELRQMGYLKAFGRALARLQEHQLQEEGLQELKGKAIPLGPPMPIDEVPLMSTSLLRYDTNKYLNIVLLHDQLDQLEEQGLSSFMEYPEHLRLGLERYLNHIADHCRALPDFSEGTTLLVLGGLGRGFALGFNDWPERWHLSVIRISDLLTLIGEQDQPIKQYLKFIKQKEWVQQRGVHFLNANGDYNLYCYWRKLRCQIVPRELPVNDRSVVYIGNDMVLPIRQEVRNSLDPHVIATADGRYHSVIRLGAGAYFKSMQGRPIYVSLDHVREGVLAGAVETTRGPSWLLVEPREGARQIRPLLYELWSGFIGLHERLVSQVEALCPKAPAGPIEVHLDFDAVVVPKDYAEPQSGVALSEPEVTVGLERRTARVKFPSDLFARFQQPENIGERFVARSIAKGLIYLMNGDVDETVLDDLMRIVIDDPGMRVFHLFRTCYPIEHLLGRQENEPIFLAHEDFVFSKLKLSEGCTKDPKGTSITSKAECNAFLHRVVDKVWSQIRAALQQVDRASVIRQVLEIHEAALRDRDHWRRTAQAVLALYGPRENVLAVAQERESKRSDVSIAARTILEMAVCECPETGGRQLCRWGLDEVLARAALLVEVATDSDAISNDLIKPRIELHQNGEYTVDRGFRETLIKPFLTGYFREGFETAAAEYEELYQNEQPAERRRFDELLSADFIKSFRTEFGLTPDEVADSLAELMDLAVERDAVVVETTLGELKDRLTKARSLSSDATQAFIRAFSIFHRPAWDVAPPGFQDKDLYPWRFRRRLSMTARPILAFGEHDGDKVFYGAGTLKLGVQYVLERSEEGYLPQDFFTAPEMKQYIGTVSNERGDAFARFVADQLREGGWQARDKVQMTELGGSAELGDVDVLAWTPGGEVQIIECKRLQLARTVAEVAEICRRFRGEAKDELAKHVRRVDWIRANPASLQGIVGFVPDPTHITDRLVTSTHVPFMYLTSLPIQADKIGPLTWSK